MKRNLISYFLVFIQFLCIGLLMYKNSFPENLIGKVLVIMSLLVALFAFYDMRRSKFTVSPAPREKAILIETGIYAFIRHPMYLAVLLFCLGYIWNDWSYYNVIIYGFLAIDLLVKLHWEEKLLTEKFSNYSTYQKKTKKLLPFIF